MATSHYDDGNIARFAIEQALADYQLTESDENSHPSSRKYSTADILTPSPTGPSRSGTEELRRHSSVKSSRSPRASAPARPSLLRKSSSLDSLRGPPGRLRLSERERVDALRRESTESRGDHKRQSLDVSISGPLSAKEDAANYLAKKSRVEELHDDSWEREYRSLDVSRRPSMDSDATGSPGRLNYNSSVAAEFGLGPTNQEDLNEYIVWNASITNMRICPVQLDGGLYFYVEARSFIPKRPGITIHAGSSKDGRIVGAAHLDYFSTDNLVGVGDIVGNPAGMVWYKLHHSHGNVVEFFTHVKYTFEMPNDETGEVRKFEWYRTKNLPIIDDQGDLALVEEGKTDVLAEYKGHGPIGQVTKQRGSLKIMKKEELGPNWQMLVLLSWASIVEMSRRRARWRRSSVFRAGIF